MPLNGLEPPPRSCCLALSAPPVTKLRFWRQVVDKLRQPVPRRRGPVAVRSCRLRGVVSWRRLQGEGRGRFWLFWLYNLYTHTPPPQLKPSPLARQQGGGGLSWSGQRPSREEEAWCVCMEWEVWRYRAASLCVCVRVCASVCVYLSLHV